MSRCDVRIGRHTLWRTTRYSVFRDRFERNPEESGSFDTRVAHKSGFSRRSRCKCLRGDFHPLAFVCRRTRTLTWPERIMGH